MAVDPDLELALDLVIGADEEAREALSLFPSPPPDSVEICPVH